MTHSFQRYTAAGNTFVVMNTWEDPLSLSRESMRAFVRVACDYKAGIGSDGVVLVNHSGTGAHFRMDFYNPDGSTGMLCGNGARCAVQAASDFGYLAEGARNHIPFEVLGAKNRADILANGDVRVFFQDPSVVRLDFLLPLENSVSVPASYVDLGSQHAVIFFDALARSAAVDGSLDDLDVAYYGPLVRWHSEFAPLGANANFIEVREDGDEKFLRIRTFERGVEGETLACGTGCMSAAIVARALGRIPRVPVRLLTQSGEFVTVAFTLEQDKVRNLSLSGSVVRGEGGTLTFDEEKRTLDVVYW